MPPCKCCGAPATPVGSLDFNKSAMDQRLGHRAFPEPGEAVPYFACPQCGLIFTPFCDGWSVEEFRSRIYNADYGKADSDPRLAAGVEESRSYANGKAIGAMFDGAQKQIRILDFGAGGNPGRVGQGLIDMGFDVTSYEPYFPGGNTETSGTYDVICALEVLEHCHDLDAAAKFLMRHLAPAGLLFMSTMLHPYPTLPNVLDSWYIAPRNGHISIFTLRALTLWLRRGKINVMQSVFGTLGFRQKPNFPNSIFV